MKRFGVRRPRARSGAGAVERASFRLRLRRRAPVDPVAHEVDEGVQLAEHTCRFRLKNQIIVATLRDGRGFDPAAWTRPARTLLDRLARDAESAAIRMIDERGAAELASGKKQHEHDYRVDDLENLRRRERVYRAVARRLRGVMTDEARLAALVEDARRQAWDEIGEDVVRRLERGAATVAVTDPAERASALVGLAADLESLRGRAAERGEGPVSG